MRYAAGVYFERILKGSTTSLWMRNVQMGVTSLVLGLLGVYGSGVRIPVGAEGRALHEAKYAHALCKLSYLDRTCRTLYRENRLTLFVSGLPYVIAFVNRIGPTYCAPTGSPSSYGKRFLLWVHLSSMDGYHVAGEETIVCVDKGGGRIASPKIANLQKVCLQASAVLVRWNCHMLQYLLVKLLLAVS